MAKPTESVEWSSNAGSLKTATTSGQKTHGWNTSDGTATGDPPRPNLQNQNYWQYAVYKWIEYLEQLTDNSAVPLGGIIGVSSDLTGAFDSATGVVTDGFMYCDGAAIPGGNAVSGSTPNLTDDRFLMGSTVGGSTGGNTQLNLQHAHNLPSHSHTVNSHTHTIGAHSHTATGYARISLAGGSGTLHSKNVGVSSWTPNERAGVTNTGSLTARTTAAEAVITVANSSSYSSGSASPGTSSASPTMDNQLSSTQDIRPKYLSVKYFMRVS